MSAINAALQKSLRAPSSAFLDRAASSTRKNRFSEHGRLPRWLVIPLGRVSHCAVVDADQIEPRETVRDRRLPLTRYALVSAWSCCSAYTVVCRFWIAAIPSTAA